MTRGVIARNWIDGFNYPPPHWAPLSGWATLETVGTHGLQLACQPAGCVVPGGERNTIAVELFFPERSGASVSAPLDAGEPLPRRGELHCGACCNSKVDPEEQLFAAMEGQVEGAHEAGCCGHHAARCHHILLVVGRQVGPDQTALS